MLDTMNFILFVARFREILMQISGALFMHLPLFFLISAYSRLLTSLNSDCFFTQLEKLLCLFVLPPLCNNPETAFRQAIEAILEITSLLFFFQEYIFCATCYPIFEKYCIYVCTIFQLFKGRRVYQFCSLHYSWKHKSLFFFNF